MKKITLLFAFAAVLTGVGSAVATTGKPSADASAEPYRNWINWNDELVLVNVPKSIAEQHCAPSIEVCLRAQDNVYVYTTGYMLYK
ncbi:hypothetical protein [Chitinophaga rhizophila]|uniref:Uncharacterized protein n=1 Tax=Chitinophaga rhizophila TaxID=2866212 RepID=A0ABS7GGI2_9BACT|nr:hypothetical protein [Chitinophaga rhizophila]MBW8686798.1 hypothetical protein [Chitinophaga rhizophila]